MMNRNEMVNQYLQILNLTHNKFDLSFLNDLLTGHVSTFPFSSLSCQLGDELPLDFLSLYQRIVINKRGGYCFEQNALLFEVLDELGFSPKLYLARVVYNQAAYPGLTHRITVVECGGTHYVLDVGFGPLGPRMPVPMSGDSVDDGHHNFRVIKHQPDNYHLQIRSDKEYFALYQFELTRYGSADCEIGHFYSHKHPNASFMKHLVVSLLLENETRSLRDLTYRVITKSNTNDLKINTAEQLKKILAEELGLQITVDENAELFKKLNQAAAQS